MSEFQWWEMIAPIITVIIAILMYLVTRKLKSAAERSAVAAEASAQRMKENIELQARSQVLNEYSDVDMGEHIAKLYEAFRDDSKAKETIDCFNNAWCSKNFSEVDTKVNNARRRVAWYFTKIHSLHKANMLKMSDVRELTTKEQVKDILLGMVEKIDKPKRRDNEVYAFFRALYPDENKQGKIREEKGT